MEKNERENIVSEHSSEKFISYLLAVKQLRKLIFFWILTKIHKDMWLKDIKDENYDYPTDTNYCAICYTRVKTVFALIN